MKKVFNILVVLLSVITFTGCSDSDLFDQNAYNSILKAGFPIDSIDSTQNWKTTGSANVSVYVNLDYGETYTVKVSLSIIGLWMLARKYVEQWFVWLFVDAIYCGLYWYKDLPFTAVLYGIYTIIAIIGYRHWEKMMAEQ